MMSVSFRESRKWQEFHFIGLIVHAVREWQWVLVHFFFRCAFRHQPVGEKHELFDELVRFLAFLHNDADGLACFIQFEADFH